LNILYDNIIFDLQRSGGISLYWSELAKQHLLAKENAIAFLERDTGRSGNFYRRNLHLPQFSIVRYRRLLPLAVERYLPITKQLNFDVFHSSYYRCMSENINGGVSIVTAHDFIYERFAKGLRKAFHSSQKYRALSRADGIICISESTKKDLLNFYPELSGKPIRVIYNGVSNAYNRLEEDVSLLLPGEYHITFPFILYVGARTASYKNFRLVVDALKSNPSYNLVLVGGGDLERAERHMLSTHLYGRYQHLQYIPESDLNMLYNAAHCLLYLSSCEGFGLPLLEAQQAGCPVIACHNSSIPEVAACPESLLKKPYLALVNREIIALERQSYREQQTKPGILKSQCFSWDKCYEETVHFYKEVLQQAERSRSIGRVKTQRIIRKESHV
jgi:glycosyltransferase involved in cell wall biosynthesis